MTTQILTVSDDWLQVSDGTSTKTIQILDSKRAYLYDSPTKPGAQLTGHVVDDYMTITAPTVAWVKAIGDTSSSVIKIAVS